jgi:hypothetical protein
MASDWSTLPTDACCLKHEPPAGSLDLREVLFALGLQDALGDELGLTCDLSHMVGSVRVASLLHLNDDLIQGSYKLGGDNLSLGLEQLSGAVRVGGL